MTRSITSRLSGVFITLEGIDGTGKSTQAALLVEWLTAQGRSVVHTREPGGTWLGGELRALLLGLRGHPDDGGAPVPVAEMLLMAADRAQHVEQVIRPALAAGRTVVCERFVDSSLAYQAAGLGLPEGDVRLVNDVATGGLRPDLTIWLDLDPARAYGRDGQGPDRIERRGLEFQRRVRSAYEELAKREPDRWVHLPVDGVPVGDVQAAVVRAVEAYLVRRESAADGDSNTRPGSNNGRRSAR